MKNNTLKKYNRLIVDLNKLLNNLNDCRLIKNKPFKSVPEYILFTVVSYCKLELTYHELEKIIDQLIMDVE